MTMIRKLVRAQVQALGEDEVEVIMSTAALARDGHILVPQGCQLENYRANPIILWQHDPEHPVGTAEDVTIGSDKIVCRIRFAPIGISRKADEVRGLVKSGVVRAVSVGFEPIEMEPLNPNKPRGGQRISVWDLLEASFVSVPSDAGALVTARAKRSDDMAEWKVGASRNLPIEDSDEWDGDAAAKSIFEWAGGDDFEPAKARKGFLVYDSEKPEERGSYKLPIAHVVDGRLKVPKGAIRAAAADLPKTDIPDDAKKDAEEVLAHYKDKADIADKDSGRSRRVTLTRGAVRKGAITFKRGVYDVAALCYAFENLGWQLDMAKWEAAMEGDGSKVPAMLAAVLNDLGEALVAMTEEEVAEALEGRDIETDDPDEDDDVLVVEERNHIAAAKTPRLRAFRRGLAHAKLRAGKILSAETVRCLREAQDLHTEARDLHRSAMRKHKEAMDKIDGMVDGAGEDGTADSATADTGDAKRQSADYARRQADLRALVTTH